MRYLLLFAILSIAPICAAFQNEPTGFRGIEWGLTERSMQRRTGGDLAI